MRRTTSPFAHGTGSLFTDSFGGTTRVGGGIFNRGFVEGWSKAQVYTLQNGRGTRGFKSKMTGDWVSGPETLSDRYGERSPATTA